MSAVLNSTRHAIRTIGKIRELEAGIAQAAHDEVPCAGQYIHSFMSASDDLLMLSDDQFREILSDLQLTLSRLDRRAFRVRFAS